MLIISAVQFSPKFARGPADVNDNFKKCEPLIHDAWKMGSQLVVFPELFLTGYSFKSTSEAAMVAEKYDGLTFRHMRMVAVELSAYVVYGYVEADSLGLYNSASIIDPQGNVACRYRKVNLWGNDFLWAKPGSDTPKIINTEFGTLSTVICRDIRAKIPGNIPRTASSKLFFEDEHPEIIAACANWGKGGFPSTTWMDFATNHGCTLVVANRYGIEVNDDFEQDFGCGGSIIIEKDWNLHTNGLKFNKDCVVTANLETV